MKEVYFMKTQLDMFSPLYYSTLGYDEELIDYLAFIEDDIIRELYPIEIKEPCGRKAWDTVILFRMHFLYFTKPEFISFRQLCKELSKPKHQDYRNFIGLMDGKVPSHAALSRFRRVLGIDKKLNIIGDVDENEERQDAEQTIDGMNRIFINQAKGLDGFLNLMLGSLDSRPVFAKVGGFKKECICKTPDNCSCKVRFSDLDAKVGRQRSKVNGNRYFVGYRKNTVVCPSSQGPMPVGSVIVDAKTSDSTMLLKSLDYLKAMQIELPFLIADMGYVDGADKVTALTEHHVVVSTEVKKNMIRPDVCDEKGRLLCPEGHVAEFLGFDYELQMVNYGGDKERCHSCIRNGICDKDFTYSFKEEPQFFGPVPQGSNLQEALLKFRKQSELNFALEANLLDSVFRHKKLPIRRIKRVEIYLKLADICRLIVGMRKHCHERYVPEKRSTILREMAEKDLYGYIKMKPIKKVA